ncbi:hypothetical protein KFL_000160220 [Klebsormidium nitens]|uniref:Uncharacterized protein n=1 Tax=Klebsormidium nitens TaxID=105231 RepID=A0A1Y1HN60_KLENI|nr:hypothetical protein KFL_000160220 [Klebsormidium nitens]|eukprot:GAQ78619.1 hypothetical protein KFL_000160220 [Klebsormidium nitens]
MADRRHRRRGTIREPASVLEVLGDENGDGNESNLTQQGVATIIMHAAMLFLDTPRCLEQLLHWRKEVSKPKIGVCLAKTPFIARLLHLIMEETRLYGVGSNQLPPHVGENLADMLVQVWQHMTPQTMSEDEVEAMMVAVERVAKQWHEAPTSVLVASSPHLPRMLHTIQLYTKRALELSIKVLESPAYKTARLRLQELQARIQVEVGAWSRLAAAPLHSALPGPLKTIRVPPDAVQRPSTASVAAPLANWVKVGPGRVRPWSAQLQLASPKARLPLPWKGEGAKHPKASLEQTLKPLAPEFLASRPARSDKSGGNETPNEKEREEQVAIRRRLQSAIVIKRNLIAYMNRRATAKLAETHREYCERVLAQGRSTSSALLSDLRYMQEQVGAGVGQGKQQGPLPGPENLDVISEEEQDEFRQYLQKAGIR